MTISEKGIRFIKLKESLHDGDLTIIGLQPKMCPAGIWTCGYGHAMIDPDTGKFLKGITNKDKAYHINTINTEADADRTLRFDIKKFESIVNHKIRIQINQSQFDALVSHTYNTGGSDTLFKLINERANPNIIRNWFESRYITSAGKVLKGLINRRKQEADMFFG